MSVRSEHRGLLDEAFRDQTVTVDFNALASVLAFVRAVERAGALDHANREQAIRFRDDCRHLIAACDDVAATLEPEMRAAIALSGGKLL